MLKIKRGKTKIKGIMGFFELSTPYRFLKLSGWHVCPDQWCGNPLFYEEGEYLMIPTFVIRVTENIENKWPKTKNRKFTK